MSKKCLRNLTNKLLLQNSINKSTFNSNSLHGLQNTGSSCYLDSVLFCLLAIPNEFINNNILFCDINEYIYKDTEFLKKVQKVLLEITRSIRITKDVKSCAKFSNLIEKCQLNGMPNFGNNGNQDAGEFLIYILSIFNINCKSKIRIENYATNIITKYRKKDLIKTSTFFEKNGSILLFIDCFKLIEKNSKSNLLFYFTKNIQDTGELQDNSKLCIIKKGVKTYYNRQITYTTLIDTPYLIFSLQRINSITNNIINTEIIPTQKITLESGRILYLNSIILYIGDVNSGHYITYFRYNKKWYTYDDIGAKISIIGNYFKMLSKTPSVKNKGVLYFYSEK